MVHLAHPIMKLIGNNPTDRVFNQLLNAPLLNMSKTDILRESLNYKRLRTKNNEQRKAT